MSHAPLGLFGFFLKKRLTLLRKCAKPLNQVNSQYTIFNMGCLCHFLVLCLFWPQERLEADPPCSVPAHCWSSHFLQWSLGLDHTPFCCLRWHSKWHSPPKVDWLMQFPMLRTHEVESIFHFNFSHVLLDQHPFRFMSEVLPTTRLGSLILPAR